MNSKKIYINLKTKTMKKYYYLIPVFAVSITVISLFVCTGLAGIISVEHTAVCIIVFVLAYNTEYTLKLNERLIKQNKELLASMSESVKITDEWIGRCHTLEVKKEIVTDECNQLRKDYDELKKLSEIQFLR